MLIDELLPFDMSPSFDCAYPDSCFLDNSLLAEGLGGMLALTSFAYTNMGELSGLIILVADSLRSNRGGLDEIDEPGPSLSTLDALDLRPEVEIFSPSPLVIRTSCGGVSLFSINEFGLVLLGVAHDVPFGVDEALSTLAFLDPDRGVMLEFKKVLTGVATPSSIWSFSRPDPSTRPSIGREEDALVMGDARFLAVPLLDPGLFGNCVVVFERGRRLRMPLGFSVFITAAPCRVVAGWL